MLINYNILINKKVIKWCFLVKMNVFFILYFVFYLAKKQTTFREINYYNINISITVCRDGFYLIYFKLIVKMFTLR